MDELDKLEQALRKITSGQAIHQFAKQETPKLKNVIISAIQEWYSSYSPKKAPASEPVIRIIEQKGHALLVDDFASFIEKFMDL